MPDYEVVIGLETHIQLNTNSKIFCGCRADSWEDEPNTNICPVCSGLPGTLPVLNKAAVEKAVLLAHAMKSEIRSESFFDRKNYFYPDLPKGYQITQFDKAVGSGGYIDLPMDGYTRRVTIEKLHLEEDAGKTKHNGGDWMVDFNRCGVPLVEMVTAPALRSADEAAEYLIRLRQLLRWLNISEANMEKAHLRADANVSIRLKGETHLNTKTEIKNVNSIEAVRAAINFEVKRQIKEVEAGSEIKPWETGWDEYWVSFDGDMPRRLVEQGLLSPKQAVYDAGLDESILRCYKDLIDVVVTERTGYRHVAAMLTAQLIARARTATQVEDDPAQKMLREAIFYIEQNVDQPINVEQLAKTMNVGYSSFRHEFKRQVGLSPKQYHLQLRINKAKSLLTNTQLTVTEVADALNFKTPYYFMKLFKKRVAMSPTQWRRYSRGGEA